MSIKITEKEFLLVLAITLMGFIFSMRESILWLNTLNPFQGLIVYYAILYTSLYLLSRAGLIIWEFKIEHPLQVLGATLIIFSFFITVNWENPYVQYITRGSFGDVSTVFYQSEDGATWYLWSQVVQNIELLRILTFIITPFILSLIGVLLVKEVEF